MKALTQGRHLCRKTREEFTEVFIGERRAFLEASLTVQLRRGSPSLRRSLKGAEDCSEPGGDFEGLWGTELWVRCLTLVRTGSDRSVSQ